MSPSGLPHWTLRAGNGATSCAQQGPRGPIPFWKIDDQIVLINAVVASG